MAAMDDETANILARMLDEPFRDYWPALGQFIHVFSGVESTLHSLVYHYAGVSEKVGKAIFHGLRVDNAKDTINRILEAKGDLETIELLKPVFAQVGVIASMRNHIVHWGARDTTDGLIVSNDRVAFTKARRRTYPASPTVLDAMRADLATIQLRLLFVMLPAQKFTSGEFAASVQARPWQYKPPQQSRGQKPTATRAPRQERKRQQDASQS